jgi:hypothetical protein
LLITPPAVAVSVPTPINLKKSLRFSFFFAISILELMI